MSIAKWFPIQDGPMVPWVYMAPHEAQAQKNHSQSLARLAERGGLGCGEAELIVTARTLYPARGEPGYAWGDLKRQWIERAEKVNAAHTAQAEELARFQQLVCDFQAAAMLDVGGQGGPCCVEPKHVAAHVQALHALADAAKAFVEYGDGRTAHLFSLFRELCLNNATCSRNDEDKRYWQVADQTMQALNAAVAAIPREAP